jgi:hypothetical protein
MDKQRSKLLKAKISLALHDELGRTPSEQEINRYYFAARVLYKAVLGTHFERKAQKKNKQLVLF